MKHSQHNQFKSKRFCHKHKIKITHKSGLPHPLQTWNTTDKIPRECLANCQICDSRLALEKPSQERWQLIFDAIPNHRKVQVSRNNKKKNLSGWSQVELVWCDFCGIIWIWGIKKWRKEPLLNTSHGNPWCALVLLETLALAWQPWLCCISLIGYCISGV